MTDKIENSEEKKEDIASKKSWFKNPYNLALIAVMLFALVIRLYYFFRTLNQPLWWDEAEYMALAKFFAFGGVKTGVAAFREFLLPYIWSIILRFGGTEIAIRIFQLLISFFTVWLTYLAGKEMHDRRTGIIASLMMSVFWLHLFLSVRMLIYLEVPFFFVLITYLFWKGYVKKENSLYLYLGAIIAGIGMQIYYSVGFIIPAIFFFLLITERLNFLKKKEIWISFGLIVLAMIPFMIYSQLTSGYPIPRLAAAIGATGGQSGYLAGLWEYAGIIISRMDIVSFILFLLGITVSGMLLGWDLLNKEEGKKFKGDLFSLLAILSAVLIFNWFGAKSGVFSDFYVAPIFAFMFIISSRGIVWIYDSAKKYNKWLAIVIVIGLLGWLVYSQLSTAKSTIDDKITSYSQFKDAGLWLKENSDKNTTLYADGVPQITYYSERETLFYPKTEEDFDKEIETTKPDYMVMSVIENPPKWVYAYPQEHNETIAPVYAIYLDKEKTNPALIVYKFI